MGDNVPLIMAKLTWTENNWLRINISLFKWNLSKSDNNGFSHPLSAHFRVHLCFTTDATKFWVETG